MGIYWCAYDENKKTFFEPPKDFSIKSPGIFHPTSPFPNMVVMMNSLGYDFSLACDVGWEGPYGYDVDKYKDITEEVYEKYLSYFPWAKEEIYEPKEKE